jgi:hypothetical protein
MKENPNQKMIDALERNLEKFSTDVNKHVNIGFRPHGTKYSASYVFTLGLKKFAVVSKFQNTGGSVDFKLPYELISLANCVNNSESISQGYLILGGLGYGKGMLKFITQDVEEWINIGKYTKALLFEDFLHKLRNNQL